MDSKLPSIPTFRTRSLAACSARVLLTAAWGHPMQGFRQGMRCTGSRSGRPSLPVPQCLGRCRPGQRPPGKAELKPRQGPISAQKEDVLRHPADKQIIEPRAAQGLSHPRVSLGIHQVPLLGPIGRVRQAAIHRVAAVHGEHRTGHVTESSEARKTSHAQSIQACGNFFHRIRLKSDLLDRLGVHRHRQLGVRGPGLYANSR